MNVAILISILVLVVIAVGLGFFITTTLQQTIPGTVEQSLGNLFSQKSFKLDSKIEADVQITTEQGPQQIEVSFEFTDVIDNSDSENLKSSGSISIGLTAEGMEFLVAGEVMTFGQDVYFKLTTFPAFLPFLQDLEGVKGQWFKIEGKKLKEIGEGAGAPMPDEQEVKKILGSLKDLIKGKELFEIDKDLGAEELDGKEATHYLVSLNKETIKELIPEFFQAMEQYVSEGQKAEYERNLQETLQDFPQKFDEAWAKIGGASFEIWVDDGILKKFKWEKEIDLTSFEALRDKIEQGIVNLVVECKFSDFNKKFEIEKPTDFRSIEELLPEGMFGSQGAIIPGLPYSLPQGVPGLEVPEYTSVPE